MTVRQSFFYLRVFLFLFIGLSQAADEFQSGHFELIELADGVYAAIHKMGDGAICNTGIVGAKI